MSDGWCTHWNRCQDRGSIRTQYLHITTAGSVASERHPGRNQLTLASWVLEGRCTLLLFSNSWAGSQPTSLQEDSHFTPVWTRLIRTNTEKGCISYSVSGQHTYPGRNVRCMLTWKASTLLRNQAQLLANWDTLSSSAHVSSPSIASPFLVTQQLHSPFPFQVSSAIFHNPLYHNSFLQHALPKEPHNTWLTPLLVSKLHHHSPVTALRQSSSCPSPNSSRPLSTSRCDCRSDFLPVEVLSKIFPCYLNFTYLVQ